MAQFDLSGCVGKWLEVTITESGDIKAKEFLDACEKLTTIFDCLGSGLGMVKGDMTGNINHIRNNMASFPPDVTLREMVAKDIADRVTGKDGTTAMSLLWLKR